MRVERSLFHALKWSFFAAAVGASALLAACSSSTSNSSTGGQSANGEGLPCDVTKVLQDRCWSCHGATPAGGAPMSLSTYDDMVAPGKTNAAKTNAELSVERMKSTTAPMPPAGGLDAAEIAVLEAWIAAGSPKGDCTIDPGSDPFGGDIVCTSGQNWIYGDDVSDPMRPQMNPGKACNECHATETLEAPPIFFAAGTVYPTGHEPDLCYGVTDATSQNMFVRIVDSMNNSYDMPVNATGNFMLFPDAGPFVPPYTAKVVSANGERAMQTPQTSGDCNACHTTAGGGAYSTAPGRIVAP